MSRYADAKRGDFDLTYEFEIDDWDKELAHRGVVRMARGWEPKPEVEQWIEDNCTGKWWYCTFIGSFNFHLETDATMFKLRWK